MYETYEIRKNAEIEAHKPRVTPLCKVYSGSVWQRDWSDDDNEIYTDYVVYIGVKSKFPTHDKFGFKLTTRSIHRRAFRFTTLDSAMNFANLHSIILEEE